MTTATPPWKRKRPAKPKQTMTAAQKARARAAAKKAGRPYPNLVDNMNAMRPAAKQSAKQPARKKPR